MNNNCYNMDCPWRSNGSSNPYHCACWACQRRYSGDAPESITTDHTLPTGRNGLKVYISGKITGYPGYKEKFETVAEELERQGHIVLNPAELPEGMDTADYMRICLAMMDCAEAVMFLPDWAESKGSCMEHALCRYTRKQVAYWEI